MKLAECPISTCSALSFRNYKLWSSRTLQLEWGRWPANLSQGVRGWVGRAPGLFPAVWVGDRGVQQTALPRQSRQTPWCGKGRPLGWRVDTVLASIAAVLGSLFLSGFLSIAEATWLLWPVKCDLYCLPTEALGVSMLCISFHLRGYDEQAPTSLSETHNTQKGSL